MMVRREVLACEDLMPAFAIRPMTSAVSSAENPSAPAIGAQYLKVSPIMNTFVFALELAATRMSAKCPESLAVKPNAVSASVTISDVVARSSPDAAAVFESSELFLRFTDSAGEELLLLRKQLGVAWIQF